MTSDLSRRSTAAQFFMEEEPQPPDNTPTSERVVELLNQASLLNRDADKITKLKLVQELIVHKEPALLDNFLDEMLAYVNDRSAEVRKCVVQFLEESSKKDPEMLPKAISNLNFIMQDENVQVLKRVMLSMAQIFRIVLQWIGRPKTITDEMAQTWQYVMDMKSKIIDHIDSDNDGIRTHAVKFLESVVLCLSKKTPESELPKKLDGFSLDQLPEEHKLFKIKKLEDEGKKAFDVMLAFMASPHISSVNLMTCMGSCTAIAKQRPQFMTRVVQSFETLHVNLPPTLAKSQVSSVRKNLKMQMLALLKHPSSFDMQPQITTLLTDLGATQAEVMKNIPKISEEIRKRKAEAASSSSHLSKKPKTESKKAVIVDKDDDDLPIGMTPSVSSSSLKSAPSEDLKQSAIDITAEDLIPRLSSQNVADLVLLSMVMLPDTMPAHFQATYTPIAAAGTEAQIKHLARLLATQLTAGGLGKGILEVQNEKAEEQAPEEEEDLIASPKHVIQTVVGGSVGVVDEDFKKPLPVSLPPPQTAKRGIKGFKLSSVTVPLTKQDAAQLCTVGFNRILQCERAAQIGNASTLRIKILTSIVSQFGGSFSETLREYIFADLRNRAELAMAWLYQEYANCQGYSVMPGPGMEKPTMASYDNCLSGLLSGLLERPDQREGLFSRLLIEAPFITTNAIQILKRYCQDETRIYLGMSTLKDLILKRPCMKLEFLDLLLDFTAHEKPEVRNNAIRVAKKLHERPDLKSAIEKYALYNLKLLLQPTPPTELMANRDLAATWTEDSAKLCLYLYLGLLPVSHELIHELANVYTATSGDIKRTILRVLENPVKGMGMQSPELLLLVENCPKGAETLITRIIHTLTDKVAPSLELVERVRDLYLKRVSDVRFLIPVLNGLTKQEVIAALPKLIKLNPVVVKEVFNRLLAGHESSYRSPLTPAELLIALHYVDPVKCDMKTIIKATNMCFGERAIYTQEVLAVVMQSLMDQNPLPTLFMRTVIQSLSMYPKLMGMVMNILQRLISKQVWKQKKVWEGFVKCCQRTKPQSFQVLLQLPAPQLKNSFEICPDLREPLLQHVQAFTPHQLAHIPKAVMCVLEKDPMEEQKMAERVKKEEEERLAAQEKLYQQKLEEERRKQQELARKKQVEEVKLESEPSNGMQISAITTVTTIKTESIDVLQEPQVIESMDTNITLSRPQVLVKEEPMQTDTAEPVQTTTSSPRATS